LTAAGNRKAILERIGWDRRGRGRSGRFRGQHGRGNEWVKDQGGGESSEPLSLGRVVKSTVRSHGVTLTRSRNSACAEGPNRGRPGRLYWSVRPCRRCESISLSGKLPFPSSSGSG
jgi:hypothetical protein